MSVATDLAVLDPGLQPRGPAPSRESPGLQRSDGSRPARRSSETGITLRGSVEVELTLEFVSRKLDASADDTLDQLLGKTGRDGRAPESPERPDADAVADRVLERIARRLGKIVKRLERLQERIEDTDDINRLARLARKVDRALKKGFAETLKILGERGASHGENQGALQRIGERLETGVGRLTEELEHGSIVELQAESETEIRRERSFSLQVQTQEGDVVTIHVDSRSTLLESRHFERDADSLSLERRRESFHEQSLSFTVDGDLNADEREAIQQLLSRTQRLSNDFYRGNLERTFEEAGNLRFDNDEIAGFSLDLQQSVEARVALSYREVRLLGAPEKEQALAQELDQFREELRQITVEFESQQLFRASVGVVGDVLNGALQNHPEASPA